MDAETYHRLELEIALDAADARRVMPPIPAGVRTILDVGCGAGQTLIASRLGPGVLAVGVDPDRRALEMGKRLVAGVQFVHARGECLPFRSGSFDMVVSRVALPYMRLGPALSEMARVIRPEGRLWFLLHPFSLVMREFLHHARALALKPALHRAYVMTNGVLANSVGVELPSPATGRYESFQTAGSMRRRLRRLGFDRFEARNGAHFTFSATKVRP